MHLQYGFYFPEYKQNVLKGAVLKRGASVYFSLGNASRTIFEGGLTQDKNHIDFNGSTVLPEMVITNSPFVNNGTGEFRFSWTKLAVRAKNNLFKNAKLGKGCALSVETDDAFADGTSFGTVNVNASTPDGERPKILLNGHDIRISALGHCTDRFAKIATDIPAKVVLSGSLSLTNNFEISGPVGLVQSGSGRFAFWAEHESTNVLAAAESGTVEILEGGGWAGPLELSEEGRAVLAHAGALSSPACEIRVSGDGWSLELPEGETVKARRLVKDGRFLPGGLYGPVGSGAKYELANITGGFLKVRGPVGMSIVVR